MGLKEKFPGGVLTFVGFMLSPLSWWNDAFVNLPLAYAFAWVVSRLYHPVFGPALIVGYWLTNLLGFILMHKGLRALLSPEEKAACKQEWKKDVIVSLLYTALLVVLIKLKILQPFEDYFKS
ncbi:MAG: hypothetical protein WCO56_08865 [Verrucomicrobiota bacterium]